MNWRGSILALAVLFSMSACAGYQTGKALNGLDTVTKEDKEEEAWFRSFYGKNHCGVWMGVCEGEGEESGGSGGGFWGGGVGPSDPASSSSSDSSN